MYQEEVAAFAIYLAALDGREVNPSLLEMYGKALLRTGDSVKAQEVLSKAVTAHGKYGHWPLRLSVAQLLLANGEYEKSRLAYLEIAAAFNSLAEYNPPNPAPIIIICWISFFVIIL